MPAFRGTDVEVTMGGVDISGDGRNVSFEQSGDALDSSAYGDTNRAYIPGLLDGQGSFEALDLTGAWSGAWDAMLVGASATMIIYPEGNTSTKRTLSFTAVITGRQLAFPYDDLATLSMSFQISGAVTEGTV